MASMTMAMTNETATKTEELNALDYACALVDGVIEKNQKGDKKMRDPSFHTELCTNLFNGGKMSHLFDINDENLYENSGQEKITSMLDIRHRPDGWIYNHFKVSLKVDGQCGAVVYDKEKNDCVLLTRYDDRKDRFKNGSNLPKGYYEMQTGNRVHYGKNGKMHHYYYEVWPRPEDGDKSKNAKLRRELYACIDSMENKDFRLRNEVFNTCEYVGPKFQCTPGVMTNNIALHVEQNIVLNDAWWMPGRARAKMVRQFNELLSKHEIGMTPKNIYNVFQELLTDETCSIEGFIISPKTNEGSYMKVRSNVFDKNCRFEVIKKSWRALLKKKNVEALEDMKEQIVMPVMVTDKRG